MQISEEQQEIVNSNTSTIVISNPGTGKTTTLSQRAIKLLGDGVKPEEILCITFTEKARKEMADAIYEAGRGRFADQELIKIGVHTFHSFANRYLDDRGLVPNRIVGNNAMSLSILYSFTEDKALNYDRQYIVSEMVPKTVSAIQYIKSFGILPDDIDIEKAGSHMEAIHNKKSSHTIDELKAFLPYMVNAYKRYEFSKSDAIDYNDMLLRFIAKFDGSQFRHVMVDEMQDMNEIQAKMVDMLAENLFLVGDMKQAIFGFQGGSIRNFEMFEKRCGRKMLVTNRRSAQQILDYSKAYFLDGTQKRDVFEGEFESFESGRIGEIPTVVVTPFSGQKILEIIKKNPGRTVGVIARTNSQILEISELLDAYNVPYLSTSIQATSEHVKGEIIRFVRGMISDRIEYKILASLTVFSPYSIREALGFSTALKNGEYSRLEGLRSWGCRLSSADLDNVFEKIVLPVCAAKGQQWFASAVLVRDAIGEYMALGTPTLEGLSDFIAVMEESYVEQQAESNVTLTTVHKAKGRAFDMVVYLPRIQTRTSFIDTVTESILASCGIFVQDELREETLRIDFVAFTRAKDQLFILGDQKTVGKYHIEGFTKIQNSSTQEGMTVAQPDDRLVEAYSLFVAGRTSECMQMLKKDVWLRGYIVRYFRDLDHLSYSSIETSPYEFLKKAILGVPFQSDRLEFGSNVHRAIKRVLSGHASVTYFEDKIRGAVQNGLDAIDELKEEFSGLKVESIESKKMVALDSMIGSGRDKEGNSENMYFTGVLDVLFKHDAGYLIVDYKVDKRVDKSKHKKQLAAYRRMLSKAMDIPEEKIDTCVIFVSLDGGINTGRSGRKTVKGTGTYARFEKDLQKVLGWKRDPQTFMDELLQTKSKDPLYLAVAGMLQVEGSR